VDLDRILLNGNGLDGEGEVEVDLNLDLMVWVVWGVLTCCWLDGLV